MKVHPFLLADKTSELPTSSGGYFQCPLCTCMYATVQPLSAHLHKQHSQQLRRADLTETLACLKALAAPAGTPGAQPTAIQRLLAALPTRTTTAYTGRTDKPVLTSEQQLEQRSADLLNIVMSASGLQTAASDNGGNKSSLKCTSKLRSTATARNDVGKMPIDSLSHLSEQMLVRASDKISQLSADKSVDSAVMKRKHRLAVASSKQRNKELTGTTKKYHHSSSLHTNVARLPMRRGVHPHTGKDCWACTECAFTGRASDVQRHARTHSGLRPYACPMCARR
jgi:hypothetical protein